LKLPGEDAEAPGGVVLSSTTAVAVEIQPLSGFVTARLYVPGACVEKDDRLDVNPFGPVHAYTAFVSGVVPVTVVLPTRQEINPPVALAPGPLVLFSTVAAALLLQPVIVSETITAYEPGSVTTGLCRLDVNPFGPVHAKVALPEFVDALTLTVSVTQVISEPVVLTEGGTLLPVTDVVEVLVHPLDELVTTSV
jgi:hypothetical protein